MLDVHEVAAIFPEMAEAEYAALRENIRQVGQREPVWTWRGKVIDGRHRQRACVDLGIEVQAREFDGAESELVPFVVSLNLHRRHLDESQRAMVAGKLATMKQGARTDIASIDAMSQTQAAELLNVSRPSVQRAREVLDHGAPELVAAVERGEVSVSAASRVVSAPKDVQAAAVAAGKEQLRHLAKLAADNQAMRADIEDTKRKNRQRDAADRSLQEDRAWFGVEYQLDCMHSLVSKIDLESAPECASDRRKRMSQKWSEVAAFFSTLMENKDELH